MTRSIRALQYIAIVTLGLQIGCGSEAGTIEDEASTPAALARPPKKKPTVVLVHGAWADALGWQEVIGRLQQLGYPVRAVEIPLSSFALDVAATQRALDAAGEAGPLIVAAHSFGGAVVTQAAVGNPNVKALVYINAFVPDRGETLVDLAGKFPLTPVFSAFVEDSEGFVTIAPDKFQEVFCADVSDRQAAMRAHTTEIDSSHVSFISHPSVVVRLIEQASAVTVR